MSEKYPFTLIKENIAKRQGKALDFAIGTQPFPLSSEMIDWIRQHTDLALAPATPKHINAFAAAAAAYLNRQFGLDIGPECILPTAGGRAGMGILAACTITPADTVIVTEPGYPAFARIAAQRGARVIASQLNPNNEFSPEFEYDENLVQGSVAMVAVNYPNNPSGATLSSAVREKLGYLASGGATLFNDATYGPLVYNDEPRSLLAEVLPSDDGPDVVELHSFSKLFPIGPLAVSFLAGSRWLVQSMATYSEYAWSPLSRLQLAATAECLTDEGRIQKFRDHVPGQLESLRLTLTEIGVRTFSANSGTYLISEVPKSIGGTPIASAQDAAKQLMESFDIAVVPLDTQNRSYLRFSALYRPHDLERLAAIGPMLRLG
ncbi:MAG: pyridoxal phosphate-dependent aminotransferase [Gammaproteobacteria bacterium]